MPNCTDRRFSTVSRRSRRDGFRHFTGAGGHSRESLFHQQGKALIVRWVTDYYPDIIATTELSTDDGTRRADVMLTWPDGHQVAVEVQYAALPAADWQARHASYLEQGITPLWLVGHLPHHLPAVPHTDDDRASQVKFTELHQAMSQADVQPLWINPILELIGTSWVTASPTTGLRHPGPTETDRAYPIRPNGSSTTGLFTADPLTACTLTPAGLTTPTTRSIACSETEYTAARARAVTHDEAITAAEQAADRLRAETARRKARERAEQHRKRRDRWTSSPEYADITADGNPVPPLLLAISPDDHTIDADPAHGRAVIYCDLIQAGDPDIPITYPAYLRVLADHQIDLPGGPAAAQSVITGFLASLVRRGLLGRPLDPPVGAEPAGYQLLGDFATVPDPNPVRVTVAGNPRACVKCRLPLAPDLYGPDRDRHLDCDWVGSTSQHHRRLN